MPSRPPRRGHAARARAPMKPTLPPSADLATLEEHDLKNEAAFRGLAFVDLDLSGRAADSVEFEECRFRNTDLSKTHLAGTRFIDCTMDYSNVANVQIDKSSMLRVGLSELRMTGLHWVEGVWQEMSESAIVA